MFNRINDLIPSISSKQLDYRSTPPRYIPPEDVSKNSLGLSLFPIVANYFRTRNEFDAGEFPATEWRRYDLPFPSPEVSPTTRAVSFSLFGPEIQEISMEEWGKKYYYKDPYYTV